MSARCLDRETLRDIVIEASVNLINKAKTGVRCNSDITEFFRRHCVTQAEAVGHGKLIWRSSKLHVLDLVNAQFEDFEVSGTSKSISR